MTPSRKSGDITEVLKEISEGDESAVERVWSLIYDDLYAVANRIFRNEPSGHTLQPTALVHEAFLKLVDQNRVSWQGRTHFLSTGAHIMRRILVDHARRKHRKKRGGGQRRILLSDDVKVSRRNDEDLLDVDDALKKLAELDERQAKIVELRFFGGLTVQEVAEVLGVSKRTVESEWTMIRAWLRQELTGEDEP